MASYADSLLADGEVVVLRQHQHWLSLLLESRIAILLWGLSAILLVLILLFRLAGATAQVLSTVALVTIVLGIIVLAYRWWQWRTEEYLITNHRLLKVTGILNKRSGDSSLEKINDAILEENLLGRILNYGDLDILTAAEVAVDRYRMLNHAKDFKKVIMAAKHALEQGGGIGYDIPTPPIRGQVPPTAASAPAAPAASAGGVAPAASMPAAAATDPNSPQALTAALVSLAQQRDSGQITQAEYNSRKEDLLGRL
jgi:hypothetical protein